MAVDIDVEALLVWTYRDQRADLYACGAQMHPLERAADGHRVFGRSADGCAAIEDRAMLGADVDVRGRAIGGMAIDDDAEHVHGLVAALGQVSSTLMRHARAGSRPGWAADVAPIRIVPLPEIRRWPDPRQPRHPGHLYCPVVIDDNAREIAFQRGQYTAWVSGLILVAYGLRMETGRLRRWHVTDALPPLAPWGLDGAG
ncbi:hypothetical protein [Zavarzinia sp.]|uniref:hypothetical protein n=1 Tax=Zavarzinia sp. TaxID=2027920 RepID=UPI003BB80C38